MKHRSAIKTLSLLIGTLFLLSGSTVMAATEQAKQQAINDGLVWLISQQAVSGDEGWWSYGNDGTLATTASVALAFIEEGYLPGENVEINDVYYGDVVGLAVNYIFNRATFDSRFGVETAGYTRYAEDYLNDGPPYDGNDLAIYFNPGNSNRNVYTTGICTPVVFALGEALGIFTEIDRGSTAVIGRTYAEVMQDIIDWFCFAQVEPSQGVYRGGWRYDANYATSDNSTALWGSLPLLYADAWGLPTPNYVYDELGLWVEYIQNANGGSGYTNPGELVNVSKTGGLLLQLAAIGADINDSRVQDAISFINSRWNNGVDGWDGNLNNAYAMHAINMGLEVQEQVGSFISNEQIVRYGFGMPAAAGGFEIGNVGDTRISETGDWLSHYCDYLVNLQNANGSWSGAEAWTGALATGWYINILHASPHCHHCPYLDIQITSTFEEDCPWYGDTITHGIRYWLGTPGFPDPAAPPAEDVVATITLSPHNVFISATGDYIYDDTAHTVTWYAGQVPDGDEYFETIITEVAGTVAPWTEMVTLADISASNYPAEDWDHDESRVIVCGPCCCVNARLGEVMFDGDTMHLTIPVELEGVVSFTPITGVDLVFGFDPAIVEVADVTFAGTLLEDLGWAHFWNSPQPGEFRLGLAGSAPIPDDGVLVFLELDLVPSAPCDGCTFLTLDLLLNEGDPCVEIAPTDDWCLPMGDVIGAVTFWGCGMVGNDYPPIPGVEVEISDGVDSRTIITGDDGQFAIEACPEECYTLTPSKPNGETDGISPLDAAMVLRHFVGLGDLMECPIDPMEMYDGSYCPPDLVYPALVAADVTGNGEIHSFDASIILKYLVGHDVSQYRTGSWEFYCDSRYFCTDEDPTADQDFVGLLFGDVTGSFGLVFPTGKDVQQSEAAIALAAVEGAVGQAIEVPVRLTDADRYYSLQFKVLYDAELLSVADVQLSGMGSGSLFEWNAEDGELQVVFARATEFAGDGELCRIDFDVLASPGDGYCLLDLENARADERQELMEMIDGTITFSVSGIDDVVPQFDEYSLHASVPNPFNPKTTISFDVPNSGGMVQLSIYDLHGRLVRRLHEGHLPGGRHQIDWFGQDSNGEKLASGTYFLWMKAPDFKQTQKLSLVK